MFIHAAACAGYLSAGELPAELRTGPRTLRTYYTDESLDYDDITFVRKGEDVEPVLRDLLSRPQGGRRSCPRRGSAVRHLRGAPRILTR